jgi:two-component system, cell cycle sensor histidine kinase and response regulator CckA
MALLERLRALMEQLLKTKRKRTVAILKQAQQHYEALVNSIDGIVWEADARTFRFAFVSQQAERLLGYPVERWLTEPTFWPDHLHPEDRAWAVEFCVRATQEKRAHELEYRIMAADGRTVWLRDIVTVVVEHKQAVTLRGVMVDITQRKLAEETLRESEERFRRLSEAANEGIAIHEEGRILEANQGLAAMYGYELADVLGRHALELAAPESRELVFHNIRSGYEKPYEALGLRKDGTTFPVEIHGKAVPYQGRLVRVTVIRDLSERQHLEAQLRQAQKMEAVGRLAGGVAHDFNNLLTVIAGYSDLLLSDLDPDNLLHWHAAAINNAAARATALTRQLLAFSRREVLQPRVLDLNAVVTDTGKMFRRLIGEDIALVTTLDPALGRVNADPGQLEQVILNLVVNARDAMPQGGRLTLETANMELGEADAHRQVGVIPGRYVRLAVRDTGIRMDAATQSHLFEPFFTSKEPGKGTGLGLATVYGIVTQSGGYIEVDSTPGRGTTFRIYLPRFEEGLEAVEPAAAAPTSLQGLETVLLVEDEVEVRGVAQQILQSAGYTVLAASDGEEAVRLCAQHAGSIHLLLTDVVMPGMSGPALASRLAAMRPAMKVMYMSGYPEDAIVRHDLLEPGTVFLPKPFTLETLLRKVRESLNTGLSDQPDR